MNNLNGTPVMSTCANQYRQNVAENALQSAFLSASLQWTLVVLSICFNGLRFSSYEANSIVLLITSSPFMCWLRALLGTREGGLNFGFPRIAGGPAPEARCLAADVPRHIRGEGSSEPHSGCAPTF